MITGKTDIYGIFGYPVEHTFSPGMHNAAFAKLDLDACYVPFPVHPDRLADATKAISALGLRGLNVTVPHKENIIPFLDELSEEAQLIGAVNTVEIREGRLIGHNTDGRGFLRSLREQTKLDPRARNFVFIGSGGAARAVSFSLALAGASRIVFYDVDLKKAGMLALDIKRKTSVEAVAIPSEGLVEALSTSDCLINATPLGLKSSDPLPVAASLVRQWHLVCDLVYNPPMTKLLKAAQRRKAGIMAGLGMLLYQGVIAFEIWTGEKAPVAVMKKALSRQIGL